MSREGRINSMMSALGNFKGVEALLSSRTITPDEAAQLRSYAFQQIGEKVKEIRREVARLQTVVEQLESVCRRGAQSNSPNGGGNEVAALRQAVAQLHGWTISLIESDYELLARTEDPIVAAGKYGDLAMQLYKLRLDRQVTRQPIPGKGRILV